MKPDPWQTMLNDLEMTAKTSSEALLIKAVRELYRSRQGQFRLNIIMMTAVAFFSIAETIRWGMLIFY